jgi:hypothetical protein
MKLPLRPIALAAAVLVVLTTPATAYADIRTHRDARQDAVRVVGDTMQTKPAHRRADIVRTRVRYSPARLTVTIRFRDLRRRGGVNQTTVVVRSPAGKTRIGLYAPFMARPALSTGRVEGEPVACAGARFAIRPGRDLVTISVPAPCVSAPDWVRVGVAHRWSADIAIPYFLDDASRRGDARFHGAALGPRVYRG